MDDPFVEWIIHSTNRSSIRLGVKTIRVKVKTIMVRVKTISVRV